jgi:hypothetical protein
MVRVIGGAPRDWQRNSLLFAVSTNGASEPPQ